MSINEHAQTFAGRKVVQWEPGEAIKDPAGACYRISVEYEDENSWLDKFGQFLKTDRSGEVTGLVVGNWGEVASGDDSKQVVEALVAAKDWLRRLDALFLGDIIMEESEISWINQCDCSGLFDAYPTLQHLCIRGGTSLAFTSPKHQRLKTLTIQAGGLPPEVVRAVGEADLPALEHLELWLGEPNYGGEATVDDLDGILSGDRYPKLRYLGLKNSAIEDDVAAAVAKSPLLDRIETLDLSMGELGDEGANALVAAPLKKLRLLDIHHHFVSPALVKRLKELVLQVDASSPQEPWEYGNEKNRFIAVGE